MTLREYRQNVLREPLRAVAARAGVDISMLSYIERGAAPNPYKIEQLARGYGLAMKQFLELCGTRSQGLG